MQKLVFVTIFIASTNFTFALRGMSLKAGKTKRGRAFDGNIWFLKKTVLKDRVPHAHFKIPATPFYLKRLLMHVALAGEYGFFQTLYVKR